MIEKRLKPTHLKVVTCDPKISLPELMDSMPIWKRKITEEKA